MFMIKQPDYIEHDRFTNQHYLNVYISLASGETGFVKTLKQLLNLLELSLFEHNRYFLSFIFTPRLSQCLHSKSFENKIFL